MSDSIFTFLWEVPDANFYVHQEKGGTAKQAQRLVTTGFPSGVRFPLKRSYSPLKDHPGLFREFAEIGQAQRNILLFANEYGYLWGTGNGVWVCLPKGKMGWGEPLADWREEIQEMHVGLELWQMIQSKDYDGLREVIRWEARNNEKLSVRYQTGKRSRLISSKKFRPNLLKFFHEADPIEPARTYLQRLIDERMQHYVSSRLLFTSEDREALNLYFVPQNLLGCLWLQFARAVDGNKQFRRCAMCEKFIEHSLDRTGSRSDKKTCSDKCRQKLSRSKKGG